MQLLRYWLYLENSVGDGYKFGLNKGINIMDVISKNKIKLSCIYV